MNDISKNPAPESWPKVPGKWIAVLVAAVVLAEAVWACLVAVANGLVLPLIAGLVGQDPQSVALLGKADVNLHSLLSSFLELGLAVVVFVLVRRWAEREPAPPRVKKVKVVRTVMRPASRSLSITPPASAPEPPPEPVQPPPRPEVAGPVAAPEDRPPAPVAEPAVIRREMPAEVQAAPAPPPSPPSPPPAAAEAPAKTKKPKEIYYNLVGEPIESSDDE